MQVDFLRVIEAAYRMESSSGEWLRELATAAYDQVGVGMGLLAFEYRIEGDRLAMNEAITVDLPQDILPMMKARIENLPPWFLRKSFVRCECTTQSEASDEQMREYSRPGREALARAFGIHDVYMLGGMDPEGDGVYLGAYLPEVTKVPDPIRETWCRVAAHIITARRLRKRLASHQVAAPDAVLGPDGRVEESRGEAGHDDSQQALRNAVLGIERARRLRRTDPDRAVDGWKGLVSARWTLVEHFESNGERYILARRNDVAIDGFEELTARERQVLSHAALGHTNKLIAYELGIAASTVRVLLHRAARKLGVNTHKELVKKFEQARARLSAKRGDGD